MTWRNPPKIDTKPQSTAKPITPEQLAASGSEDGHQMALFCWCRDNEKQYPQLENIYAIPNGGSRHIAEAGKLVAAGTRSGVPDTFLAYAIQFDYEPAIFHGLYIEMKREIYRNRKNGGCSEEQLKWIARLRNAGYAVKVCYNWEEGRDTLIAYLEGRFV